MTFDSFILAIVPSIRLTVSTSFCCSRNSSVVGCSNGKPDNKRWSGVLPSRSLQFIFTCFDTRSCIKMMLKFHAAKCKLPLPVKSQTCTLAPFSINHRATSSLLVLQAIRSGVIPFNSTLNSKGAPCLDKYRQTSNWFVPHASKKALKPRQSVLAIIAPWCRRYLTIFRCPLWLAIIRGVVPSKKLYIVFQPSWTQRHILGPLRILWFGSSPARINLSVCSRSPLNTAWWSGGTSNTLHSSVNGGTLFKWMHQ